MSKKKPQNPKPEKNRITHIKALPSSYRKEAMCKEYALLCLDCQSLKCMVSENGCKVFGMMLEKYLETKVLNKAVEGKTTYKKPDNCQSCVDLSITATLL